MMQYPGTNFHDLNLDWIIDQVKNCLAEWAETKGSWEAVEADWEGTKAYIENYFATLDVSAEVNAKIAQMANDGELLDLISEQVAVTTAAATTDWLNEKITEPEYPLDSSLTLPAAAANAKATGDAINAVSDLANIDRAALVKVTADTLANTKALNATQIPVTINWQYGFYSTNGYVYMGNPARICSQILPAGTYAFTPVEGTQFQVFKYNSDSSGTSIYNWRAVALPKVTITDPFIVSVQHATDPSTTPFDADEVNAIPSTFCVCDNTGVKPYFNGVPDGIIAEMYLLDDSYKPHGVAVTDSLYRFKMRDANDTIIVNGQNVAPQYYDGLIQTFVDPNTAAVVAYYILHYPGTAYNTDSTGFTLNANALNLDASPRIKEYLNRSENLVLIGDSIFGYQSGNTLAPMLRKISNKQVFNIGFGGCTMAKRASASGYDAYCFPSVADAIANDTYTDLISNMSLNARYPYAIAELKAIDWTKPTTVFVNYVNNDITLNHPIGDLWDYTTAAVSFDQGSVLGAFNYGLATLLGEYPHIRLIAFNSVWRKLGASNVPPYAFTNSIGKTPIDYNDAIKENAERQGISVFDAFNCLGRTWYNATVYQQDASHYKDAGYQLFAKILDALDRSFID